MEVLKFGDTWLLLSIAKVSFTPLFPAIWYALSEDNGSSYYIHYK